MSGHTGGYFHVFTYSQGPVRECPGSFPIALSLTGNTCTCSSFHQTLPDPNPYNRQGIIEDSTKQQNNVYNLDR